jgi:DNA-binding SARP family transcriptional activator/TolB-like protein/Tfp pilus assembly protein PilF
MASMRLTLLGGFRLTLDGDEAPRLPRKTCALLAHLALAPRKVTREAAGELLWSDRGAEQVRHSLRQALTELKRLIPAHALIHAADGTLALAPEVETDTATLLADAADIAALRRAAAAYAGPLLAGFAEVSADFDEWLTLTRARLEATALDLLARLADASAAAGDATAALAATERMFAIDPLREDTHRRLLEACAAAGRRSEALRHYAAIAELLRRELGISPSRETRELAQRLRREMDPLPEDALAPPTVPARPAGVGPPIAIMPYRQLGDEPVPRHLADGMVADIVCQLAGLRELSVISHGSTLGMRDPDLNPRAIGRALGARYVVQGALRRAGNQLRLTTELTEAETGLVLWARTHDAEATLTFADQDRIVAQLVHTLAPRVQQVELLRIRGKRPDSLDVYEKALVVREHLAELKRDGFAEARLLLDDIINQEPNYADAYALDANWHTLFLSQGWTSDRAASFREVDRLDRLALAHDPDNLRALVFHAHRQSLHHRDFATARRLFARALEIAPNAAAAWLWSSLTYSYVGDPQEAIARALRALALSPQDRDLKDFHGALQIAHYTAGDYESAVEWGRKALDQPSFLRVTPWWSAASFAAMGRTAEAREMVSLGLRMIPNRTVRDAVANCPYEEPYRRAAYGQHLLAAGMPA